MPENKPDPNEPSSKKTIETDHMLEAGTSQTHAFLPAPEEAEELIERIAAKIQTSNQISVHYYVKILVSAMLCALLLLVGVPVFMESRVTGSISYTALGVVLVGFGLILAASVIVLLFKPPFKNK